MPAKTPEPPKITLRFGGQRQQGPSGVSVDSEALKRQQDLVNAGANGRVPFTGNGTLYSKTWHDFKAYTLLQGLHLRYRTGHRKIRTAVAPLSTLPSTA